MIYIQKKQEPRELRQYRQSCNARFDDMDADVKNALRSALLAEQGHLCAYCMSQINETDAVKIEHFEARTPQNELVYRNLLAVCKGNEGQPKREQTCDTRKGNSLLHLSPLNQHDMEQIYYKNDGSVHSVDPDAEYDINEVLNLNYEYGFLISNRREALQKFRERMVQHINRGKSKEAFLKKQREKYFGHSEHMQPYVGILRWYIEKSLRKCEHL